MQLDIVYEENSTITQFIPSKIWKWYAVLFDIHARSEDFTVFRSQSEFSREDLKRVRSPVVITKVQQLKNLTLVILRKALLNLFLKSSP